MCRKVIEKVQFYHQSLFMIGILILHGMKSADIDVYGAWYLSVIALSCIGVKIVTTIYDRRELLWMLFLGGIAIYGFFINHSVTFVLSLFCILGVKGIELGPIFKWAFWSKLFIIPITVLLATMGIIENKLFPGLPKFIASENIYIHRDIYAYGYAHPNRLFFQIVTLALLALIVYGEIYSKWIWPISTLVIYCAYRILMCRAGWYIWLGICLLAIVNWSAGKIQLGELFHKLLCLTPLGVTTLAYFLMSQYHQGTAIGNKMNDILTRRLEWVHPYWPELYKHILPLNDVVNEDFTAVVFPFNFGLIVWGIAICAYMRMLFDFYKKNQWHYLLINVAMWIYSFSEYLPVGIASNIFLLCLGNVLYKKEKEAD